MPNINQSALLPIFVTDKHSTGYCICTLLAWVMVSDGEIDDTEMALLQEMAKPMGPDAVPLILSAIEKNDFVDIQLACEILNQMVDHEGKKLFLGLVISMAIADGYLTFAEMQIIGLVADIFRISKTQTEELYAELAGVEMPSMPDASSVSWWESKERKQHSNAHSETQLDVERIKALAVLGLDENATQEDIQKAYRRMAQVHHPDKYHSLGEEAVKAAEQSFSRIQNAYEHLRA